MSRINAGARLYRMLILPLFLPADFLVARLMLRTIKQRVEQSSTQAPERVEGATEHQVRQDESIVSKNSKWGVQSMLNQNASGRGYHTNTH